MNKLTKQLLSLGLSVVTVAGMVSPVFAEGVDETQGTGDSPIVEKETEREYALQIYKHNVDGTVKMEQTSFVVPSSVGFEDIYHSVVEQFLPEGYNLPVPVYSAVKKVDENTYRFDVFEKQGEEDEMTDVTVEFYLYKSEDKKVVATKTISVNRNLFDDEIRDIINQNPPEGYEVVWAGGAGPMVRLDENGVYHAAVSKLSEDNNKPEDNMKTYTLIINKDGVEEQKTVEIEKNSAYDISYYILANFIPEGYRAEIKDIEYVKDNTFRVNVVKKDQNPELKTWKLNIIKGTWKNVLGYKPSLFNDVTVETREFTYDSKAGVAEIANYIEKTFAPKGYVVNNSYNGLSKITDIHQIDDSTFNMLTFKNDKMPSYEFSAYLLSYVDVDTNEVLRQSGTLTLEGPSKSVLDKSDIEYIPYGYKLAGDSFKVDDSDVPKKVTITVKKGTEDSNLSVLFYANDNGSISKLDTVSVIADKYDANKDGMIDLDELASVIPSGYIIDKKMQIESAPSVSYIERKDIKYVNCYIEVCLKKVSSVNQTEDSKDIASIVDSNTEKVLASSLNTDQKKEYDAAIKAGKEVEFKPVVKNEVKESDKKALLAYADKNDTEVVNAFDIEIELLINDESKGLIPETSEKLTFKVAIPENLKKDGRKFYVLRLHDGKIDKLPVNEDGTFETDKFSSYMLVYEDVKATTPETKPEVKPEVKPEEKPEVKPGTDTKTDPVVKPEVKPATKPNTGTTTTTTDTKKNNTVKKDVKKNKKVNTSTKTSSTLFTGLLGVSIVGLGAVEVLRRRNK